MKIQRGRVKYQNKTDILSTFAVMDDGTQYFFLDETDTSKLSNGNRIVSTQLVEAIDKMVKASHIGIIDPNGVVVVSCENRSIRLVNDNVILVENAEPVSQNVLDAIALRSDPNSATVLVSTPATIKDRMNAQMGADGKFLFNDQFSEATVCDINGTNLVGGEKYSFIGVANDKLYLSKNTVDSPVSVFSLTTYEMLATSPEAIDISTAVVDQQVVEDALQNAAPVDVQEAVATSIVEDGVDNNGSVTEVSAEEPVDEQPAEEVEEVSEVSAVAESEEDPVMDFDDSEYAAKSSALDETVDAEVQQETVSDEAITEGNNEVPEDIPEGIPEPDDGELKSEDVQISGEMNEPAGEEPVGEESVEEVEDGPVETTAEDEPVETFDFDQPIETTAESELIDFPVADEPKQEKSARDISDDLKAFANGLPSDEEKTGEIVADGEEPVENDENIELPPVVEEEADVSTESEEKNDELPQELKVEVNEAALSDVVTNDGEGEQEEVIPRSIDPETVLATVDKDNNGILDSHEIMVPQDSIVEEEKPDMNQTLTDIFGTSQTMDPLPSYDILSDYSSLTDIGSDLSSYESYSSNNDIMADVARFMKELMEQYKKQKGLISQYQNKISAMESHTRLLEENYRNLSMTHEATIGKIHGLEDAVRRYQSRNGVLESTVRDLEKIISAQKGELEALRQQAQSGQALVRVLKDARDLLNSDNSGYEYGGGYRRAA